MWIACSSGECIITGASSSSSTSTTLPPEGGEACLNHRQRLEPGLQEVAGGGSSRIG
jgi:hypothetical protein